MILALPCPFGGSSLLGAGAGVRILALRLNDICEQVRESQLQTFVFPPIEVSSFSEVTHDAQYSMSSSRVDGPFLKYCSLEDRPAGVAGAGAGAEARSLALSEGTFVIHFVVVLSFPTSFYFSTSPTFPLSNHRFGVGSIPTMHVQP